MKNITGFTLIELISVIGIILILIGIGIPAYNSWINRSKITEANATIAKIEMALEMYKTDFGSYPQKTGPNNLNANGLVKTYLVNQFPVDSVNYGPYMQFKGEYTGDSLQDPWGNIYGVYTAPDSVSDINFRHNTTSYYIYSFGPDKSDSDANLIDNIDNFKK